MITIISLMSALLISLAVCKEPESFEDDHRKNLYLSKMLLEEMEATFVKLKKVNRQMRDKFSTSNGTMDLDLEKKRFMYYLKQQVDKLMNNYSTEKDKFLQKLRSEFVACRVFEKHVTEEKEEKVRSTGWDSCSSILIMVIHVAIIAIYSNSERLYQPLSYKSAKNVVSNWWHTEGGIQKRTSQDEQTEQMKAHVPFERRFSNVASSTDDDTTTNVRSKPIRTSPCSSTKALDRCGEISSTDGHQPGYPPADLVLNKCEAYDIMNKLVEANKKSNDLEGIVFSKKNFATAIVGSKGAVLSFPDQSVTLRIPAGALKSQQPVLIYRPVNSEDLQYQPLDKPFVAYTPIIHCAPEGTKFERPVELTFGHCAAFKENQQRSLTCLRRANETSPWGEINQDAVNVQIDPNMMTVEISGFSDYVGCSDKDLFQDTALISAVHRGQRDIGTSIYSVMNIPGFYQNNLDLIRKHSNEIREANVIVDSSKVIYLEGDSAVMQFATNSATITVNKTEGFNSSHFEMSPIQGASIQHTYVDLATVSLRQTKNMPFATVAIQRNGHRIEVNNASSLQKTKLYQHPTQAEFRPHQTKLLSQIPPSGQQLASTLGLTVTDGRVNSDPQNEVFSNDSAEPSGGATSASSDEEREEGRSAPDGAPSDSNPPEVEASELKDDAHASLEKNGPVDMVEETHPNKHDSFVNVNDMCQIL